MNWMICGPDPPWRRSDTDILRGRGPVVSVPLDAAESHTLASDAQSGGPVAENRRCRVDSWAEVSSPLPRMLVQAETALVWTRRGRRSRTWRSWGDTGADAAQRRRTWSGESSDRKKSTWEHVLNIWPWNPNPPGGNTRRFVSSFFFFFVQIILHVSFSLNIPQSLSVSLPWRPPSSGKQLGWDEAERWQMF